MDDCQKQCGATEVRYKRVPTILFTWLIGIKVLINGDDRNYNGSFLCCSKMDNGNRGEWIKRDVLGDGNFMYLEGGICTTAYI